jgi:hypothetical protein
VYSCACKYSTEFINAIPDIIFETALVLCIDKNTDGKRLRLFQTVQDLLGHQITEVPTVIVKGGEFVLTGQEAFRWLEYTLRNNASAGTGTGVIDTPQPVAQIPAVQEHSLEMFGNGTGYSSLNGNVDTPSSFVVPGSLSGFSIPTPAESSQNDNGVSFEDRVKAMEQERVEAGIQKKNAQLPRIDWSTGTVIG